MATKTETLNVFHSHKLRERTFFTGMAIIILIVVFAGFSRTFYLRPYFSSERLIPLLIMHGLVFSSWIALFITQTALVAAKRVRTHMMLGIAGGVIAALMIIVGTVTALLRALAPAFIRARAPSPIPGVNPLTFLTIPLGDMLVFAILVSSAFYFRRRVDVHKRLMLLATIGILPAAVARLPFPFIQHYGPLAFFGLTHLPIVPFRSEERR